MGYKQSNPIRNFKFSIKNIKFLKEKEMKKPIHNLFGLKNGRLLANSNNEILLLNQENFEILFTLRLPHQPQEILEIKHDKILFALFGQKSLKRTLYQQYIPFCFHYSDRIINKD